VIAGRYALEREIGRGGMGAVWLARDEVLGRQVALKKIGLLPGATSTDLARAEREARLAARLHHPHVVAVFDLVLDDDGDSRWLVMEYVEGTNLHELVRTRGPLPEDEAARLLGQAADALAAAHEEGIVHRDVKPSNIMVDPQGNAKLTDFGIARITADPALTQTGLLTGSPAYLAPEVATGRLVEAAADVWSLGATAYHLLAGRQPYETRENALGTLIQIVNDDPPRLPEATRLAPLIEGTLVKDPAERWTMAQVRDFLVRGGEAPRTAPIPVAPAPEETRVIAPTPAGATPARRRRSPALVALVALAGVLVLGLVLWAALRGGDGGGTAGSGTGSPSASPSRSSTTKAAAKPTAAGMESFIRDYVRTTGEDPSRSWTMLTPKFQRESGGFAKYQAFWDRATNGRVLSIQANPDDLSVSYQVRFDDFDNGPGPTVLDLAFEDGTYKIDGERTQGFTPSDG
jgi:hypothetical protein